jgi:transposase
MNTVRVRALRPYEQKKLHRLKRQRANHVNSRHARIILLSRGGMRNRDIAVLVDCSPQWVRRIIHRFNDDGVPGISWYPFFQVRDQPRKFLADIREQIAEVALSSPKALIGMKQWSLPKLRAYLVEQHILPRISLEWLRQLLRRCRISWRHTKTWKDSTDPEFWPKYRRIRRLYRQRPVGGRRLCIDEFGPLNLQPRHGLCVARRGGQVQRLRATYSRKGGVRHFLAFYDLETDRLYGQFSPRKRWVEFLPFLKWVRSRYWRGETLHIVLDNYGPHLKAEVLNWAARHNIRFYWTPTQASWLNRIESHFAAVRKFALDTSDHRSHEEQQEAMESYLAWRNRRRKLSCQSWKEYRRQQRKAA